MTTIRVGRGETKVLRLTCVDPETRRRKDIGGFRIVAALAPTGSKTARFTWASDTSGVEVLNQLAAETRGQARITLDNSQTVACTSPSYEMTVLIYDEAGEPHVIVAAQPLAFFDVPGVTP